MRAIVVVLAVIFGCNEPTGPQGPGPAGNTTTPPVTHECTETVTVIGPGWTTSSFAFCKQGQTAETAPAAGGGTLVTCRCAHHIGE